MAARRATSWRSPARRPVFEKPRRIGGGMTAVAYLWIVVDGSGTARAASSRHPDPAVRTLGAARVVESGPLPVGAAAVTIGPPARGRGWVALLISNESQPHRRGLFPVDRPRADRSAVRDRLEPATTTKASSSEGDALTERHAFGLLRSGRHRGRRCDGRKGGIDGVSRRIAPPNIAPGVGLDPEKALGNSVVLALRGGLFSPPTLTCSREA